MTDEKTDSDQAEDAKRPDSVRSREVPAESAEMARVFWSSLQEDCRLRAEEKRLAHDKARAESDAALDKLHEVTKRAASSVDDSAKTVDKLRTHGVIHYPSNKT